ncbi:MAG: caspase family protein, partial [Gemmatimonadetes bacterium]|nr:caspase family protein [Gemmatimonadota bacterium]
LLTSALLPARISAQFVSLAEWKTLGGHGGTYIGALALSPDGKLLASADLNGLIKVWSVETGQELKRLRGPNEQITALALGPDGKILVSAHSLKTKIWSVDAAQEAGSIAGPMALGMGVAISPDGKWVASAGTDGSAGAVILLSLESGDVATLKPEAVFVPSVAFSPDGRWLAAGTNDGSVVVFDVKSKTEAKRLSGHPGQVTALAFAKDGKTLASGGDDGAIFLWAVDQGARTATLEGHTAMITRLAFTPDGKRLISGSIDANTKLWAVDRRAEVGAMSNANYPALGGEPVVVATSALDGKIKLWRIQEGLALRATPGTPAAGAPPALPVTEAAAQPQPPAAAEPERRGEDSGGPALDIVEPAEWGGAGRRGIQAVARQSLRIRGQVRHSSGVSAVKINGARAALTLDESGTSGTFVGFAPIDVNLREIEVAVWGNDGRVTARVYAVQASEPPPPTAAAAPTTGALRGFKGKRWAVVVGISDYVDPDIPDLKYADDDAQAVYDFLRSPDAGLGGIPQDQMLLLLNEKATARNIRSALFTFLKQSTEDDVVFIYIAGHGMPDPERLKNLYVLAYDTELKDLAATGIPMNDVNEAINAAYARNKILFADACHSAGVGVSGGRAVNINQINQVFLDAISSSTGGFVAFTASEAAQLSQEGEQWGGGHGVFTHFILQGLQGEADEDRDYIVTLGELMEYARDRVRRETRNAQIPTISQTTYDRYWPMAIVTR